MKDNGTADAATGSFDEPHSARAARKALEGSDGKE